MSNLAEQEDELTALEAILGSDYREIENPPASEEADPASRRKTIRIMINVKLPSRQITLEAWVHLEDESSLESKAQAVASANPSRVQPSYQRSDSGHRVVATVPVEHLPPICLECTLPASYPISSPPLFTLSSLWLSVSQLSALCRHLDDMWATMPSEPIIFSWVDWLQNSAVETLGITDSIVIASGVFASSHRDPRAISECRDIEATLVSLLRFNFDAEEAAFRRGWHTCCICLDEKAGDDFFRLRECRHIVCQSCMCDFCNMFVSEGSVQKLTCPFTKCNQRLPLDVIRSVLGDEEFRRWERLVFQKSLDVMEDVEYCPRCQLPVVRDDVKSTLGQCAYCLFSFCINCRNSWHLGDCPKEEEPSDDKADREDKKDKKATDPASALARKRLRDEHLSLQAVKESSTKCPGCRSPVQKIAGCNKMTCSICHRGFCYLCGKSVDYDHFSEGGCSLFDLHPYDYIERRAQARQRQQRPEAAVRIERELGRNPDALLRVCRCPTCHQRNLKEMQNNHIRCWQCKTSFCYKCKQKITGSPAIHYGKKSDCPQHSNN